MDSQTSGENSDKFIQDFHTLYPEIVALRPDLQSIDFRSLKDIKTLKENSNKLEDVNNSNNSDQKLEFDFEQELYRLHHELMFDHKNVKLYADIVDLLISKHKFEKAQYYSKRLKLIEPESAEMLTVQVHFFKSKSDNSLYQMN
jgi:hypothetical protein